MLVRIYLLIQSFAVLSWWGLLLFVPASRAWFRPASFPDDALMAFFLPDLGLLVMGGFALVYMVDGRGRGSAFVFGLALAGATSALYCVGVSLLVGQMWLASALMTLMSGTNLAVASIYGTREQSPAAFRAADEGMAALPWTLFQTSIFWVSLLGVVPLGIVELQGRLDIARFAFEGQGALAAAGFLLFSALNIWTGVAMSRLGDGTPLPTMMARKLVVRGPYRWLRNPMALGGIMQGVFVGVFFGSWPVIAYAISGAVVWHIFVCPVEEHDLEERFGADYLAYRGSVGLWLPFLFRR